jgi:hypothetical protein
MEGEVSTTAIVVVVVVGVLLLVGLSFLVTRRRGRRRELQEQFGPEYDRMVAATGNPKEAEAELRDRVDRRQQLQLRPLSVAERDRYFQAWRQIQAQFVDQPRESLAAADQLVTGVMHDSGYPMDDFEQRADLISVDHPDVVQHYRRAHQVHVAAQQAGHVSTEDVRQALVSYRWLFAELLGPVGSPQNTAAPRSR